MIFDDDVAELGNGLIATIGLGSKTEAIAADNAIGKDDTMDSDDGIVVNAHTRMDDRIVTNADVVADVGVGVNRDPISDMTLAAHVGESTPVPVHSYRAVFAQKAGLFDPPTGLYGNFLILFQEPCEGQVGIFYVDERSGNFFAGLEILIDQYCRRLGGVEVVLVFKIG